ncbi:MAG: flippase-like domain-containing protein [Gemmatimonadetes bacterium]|nr:flippase-like domain-containing protein [Gemmatimonadota bacterium]
MGIVISIAALYFTFRRMPFAEVASRLREADMVMLLLAAAGATGVFWIRAWRWRAILEPFAEVSFRSRFASIMIGFMGNNLLPARIGEFMRAYSLSRTESVPIVSSFASLVIERLFDAVLVITLLFLAASVPGHPDVARFDGFSMTGAARGAAIFVGVLIVILAGLVLFPHRSVRGLERIAAFLPRSFRRPLVDGLEAFLSGVAMLRNPRLLLRTTWWSIVLWVFNGVGCWFAFRAFGMDLPFSAAIFLQSAIALAVSIPSGPGFFGIFQGAATLVLHDMWGMPLDSALAFGIGFHLAGFIPVTVIGLYYAWRTGLSLGEVRRSEDVVEEAVEEALDLDDPPDESGPHPRRS